MNTNIDCAVKDMWLFLFSFGSIKGTVRPKIKNAYDSSYLQYNVLEVDRCGFKETENRYLGPILTCSQA